MEINVNRLGTEEKAEVSFTRNRLFTNIWNDGVRIVEDDALIAKAYEYRARGLWQVRNAISFWEQLRALDPDTISSKCGVRISQASGSDMIANAQATSKPTADTRKIATDWTNFFSEFSFRPQARFLNSVANMKSKKAAKDYIFGYFSLTNNSYVADIKEKMKSPEFDTMLDEIIGVTDKVINERFEILYGEPGGGKTTTAIRENPTAKVVICNSGITPDELFRGFSFQEIRDETGKVVGSCPVFKPCALKEAMLRGEVVILDEINLLTMDCLRALQAVCDGKESVTIGDEVIEIKKGFKVVGTMNLVVDETVCGLPGPLVDRAGRISEFLMTAAQLAEAAF